MYTEEKAPRLTKSLTEDYIATYLGVQRFVLRFDYIDHLPEVWKHACADKGVIASEPYFIRYFNYVIVFIFCDACGKVIYTVRNEF